MKIIYIILHKITVCLENISYKSIGKFNQRQKTRHLTVDYAKLLTFMIIAIM